jgi:hypothetical protein
VTRAHNRTILVSTFLSHFAKKSARLVLQRQIIKNPTPTLTLPRAAQALAPLAEGEGILWVFPLSWKFFQSLPFQGGGQEGDGVYVSL